MNKKNTIPTYRISLVRDGEIQARTIRKAEDAVKACKTLTRSDREQFICFYLNARNQIIAHHVASIGTANASLVHPREVYKVAILKNAVSVLVAHNHPSGGAEPSEADLELTKRLEDAGKILGIELLDHIIVTPDGQTRSVKE
jgi:DNA repair protein RadC